MEINTLAHWKIKDVHSKKYMSVSLQSYGWNMFKHFLRNPENEMWAVSRMHVHLHKAEDHAVEESGYEEEYEGGGHGPQAADLIFL